MRLVSVLGMIVILGIAWLCSRNRSKFPWRVVLWGLALQFTLALLVLKTTVGAALFTFAQKAVLKLNDFANEGAKLTFGPLADSTALAAHFGSDNAFIFAISISATIIVIASLSSLLYHWGLLQRVVYLMAVIMKRVMGTSGSETLAAAANCFVGQTEAPLVIKPYLLRMTQSELLALMTGGMATIAGGVLAVYSQFGRHVGHPELAGHLMTASLMSAPGALMIAKILLPESEKSETASQTAIHGDKTATNSIDALCKGAHDGMRLSVNVMAMVLAFVAVVALANYLLQWPQRYLQISNPVTLQQLVGWINTPFAFLLGVPKEHCYLVGQILGERIILNELFGYLTLTQNEGVLDERTFILTSYALCGFANLGSVAVQIGGIGAIVPERRADLARLGLLSMFAGLLTCYLTATLVGILV